MLVVAKNPFKAVVVSDRQIAFDCAAEKQGWHETAEKRYRLPLILCMIFQSAPFDMNFELIQLKIL